MKINHPMIFLVTKQKPKLFNIFIKKKKKKHYSRLLDLIVGQIRQEEALKQKQKQKNKQKKQKNQKQKKQKQKQRASNSGT